MQKQESVFSALYLGTKYHWMQNIFPHGLAISLHPLGVYRIIN